MDELMKEYQSLSEKAIRTQYEQARVRELYDLLKWNGCQVEKPGFASVTAGGAPREYKPREHPVQDALFEVPKAPLRYVK